MMFVWVYWGLRQLGQLVWNPFEPLQVQTVWQNLCLGVFDFSEERKIYHRRACFSQLFLPVLLLHTNISKCPAGGGSNLLWMLKNWFKHGCYSKHWTRHWNRWTPPLPWKIKNVPVPPQALISSDGNQATNSNVIIIHVVNHLLLQKNYFPHCPTLLPHQT